MRTSASCAGRLEKPPFLRIGLLATFLALMLSACATTPPAAGGHLGRGAPIASTRPLPPPARHTAPIVASTLAALPGWGAEDHLAALRAFQSGCGAARDPSLQAACARARAISNADEAAARVFFEANFRPEVVSGEGVLTAYFAPEYEARTRPDGPFDAVVLGRPADLFMADLGGFDPSLTGRRVTARLNQGALQPYPDRAGLEAAPPPDPPLAWMKAEDLFFLQIQGSGTLLFPDGRRAKAVYAGDNGQPFVAIARPMVAQGLLAPNRASGDAIRGWLAAHRGPEAAAVMRLNPRYVFFALSPDDRREPPGAAGIPLTAGRSIAVDPSRHAYGELYWIDASAPVLSGATTTYRRLAVALDTGAAIRGEVRADLYTGRGDAAGREAGRVRHTLRMVRLVPLAAPAYGANPLASHEASPPPG